MDLRLLVTVNNGNYNGRDTGTTVVFAAAVNPKAKFEIDHLYPLPVVLDSPHLGQHLLFQIACLVG